ncbi:MAG: hypothetical protein RML84_09110 [Anaerolineae bacterium]|nr:hypothetical protein [Anaerolineae bacterium]
METTVNARKRTVRQVSEVSASPLPQDAEQRTVRVEAQARLDTQYASYIFPHSPFAYLLRLSTATRDELVREYGWDIYERIAQDAMVAGVLRDIVMGVVTQRPVAVAEGEDALSRAMERFVNMQLALLAQRGGVSLVELARQMLRSALVYGHVVAELVFADQPSDDSFVAEPLTSVFFTLKRVAVLLPSRYSFAVTSDGEVIGIVPLHAYAGAPLVIVQSSSVLRDPAVVPRIKLFYAVFGRFGADPTGESLLTSAFKPWAMKKQVEEHLLSLIKRIRKSWLGILPPDAQTVCVTDPETGEQRYIRPKEDLLDVLQALANGDGGVVPAGTQVQAFDVEVNAAAQLLLESHKLFNRELLRALYSRMLANNNDAAASTTGEFDRDMVAKTVRGIRAWYEDELRRLAAQLITLNFGEEIAALHTPRVVVGRGDGLPLTIRDVAVLHQAGWFTRAQKGEIDEMFGLPPDDGGDIVRAGVALQQQQQEAEDGQA